MFTILQLVKADHPELQEGEVFYTNLRSSEDFWRINYQTKRRGKTAYDIDGYPVYGEFPVFVSEEEFAQHMTNSNPQS